MTKERLAEIERYAAVGNGALGEMARELLSAIKAREAADRACSDLEAEIYHLRRRLKESNERVRKLRVGIEATLSDFGEEHPMRMDDLRAILKETADVE